MKTHQTHIRINSLDSSKTLSPLSFLLPSRHVHLPHKSPNFRPIRCQSSPRTSHEDSSCHELPRRQVLVAPILAIGLHALVARAAAEEEKVPGPASSVVAEVPVVAVEEENEKMMTKKKKEEEEENAIVSRVYDATAIGEPLALGKDKRKIVWEKLLNARIIYLGEAEQVPVRDDKELELEIVKNLRSRCVEQGRSISLAHEAFPCDLQEQLNQFMDKRGHNECDINKGK